ncbi:hypothetical protein ACFL4N_01235 [Thermodesulfobacteriota bacterium]
MAGDGLKDARACTKEGFHYDNLLKMAQHCSEEEDPGKFLTAYVMEKFFSDMATQLGDRPVTMDKVRKIEVKYRNAVNLAMEKAEAGVSENEQFELLTKVVQLIRKADQ